eukprot:1407989-Prymnesium_polylepis.1
MASHTGLAPKLPTWSTYMSFLRTRPPVSPPKRYAYRCCQSTIDAARRAMGVAPVAVTCDQVLSWKLCIQRSSSVVDPEPRPPNIHRYRPRADVSATVCCSTAVESVRAGGELVRNDCRWKETYSSAAAPASERRARVAPRRAIARGPCPAGRSAHDTAAANCEAKHG